MVRNVMVRNDNKNFDKKNVIVKTEPNNFLKSFMSVILYRIFIIKPNNVIMFNIHFCTQFVITATCLDLGLFH
jgi:hypothetical protein